MTTNELFNVESNDSIALALPAAPSPTIFIIEPNEEKSPKARLLLRRSVNRDFKVADYNPSDEELQALPPYNIVVANRVGVDGETFYVTASAPRPELESRAALAAVEESTKIERELMQEAIITAAIVDKATLRRAIDKLNRRADNTPSGPAGEPDSIINFKGFVCYELSPTQASSFSEREQNKALNELPERITAAFLNNSSKEADIVKDLLNQLSGEELRALVIELSKQKRNLLKDLATTSKKAATDYRLEIRQKSKFEQRSKTKCRYELYVINSKGVEQQVEFRHSPSMCIYVLHVLDRKARKEDARALSRRYCAEKFEALYNELYDENKTQIEKLQKELLTRKGSNGRDRKGRFDDYIADINQTFEELTGILNSIPFKIGNGRFLAIHHERITIDKLLAGGKFL